jgi:hypothetical protein
MVRNKETVLEEHSPMPVEIYCVDDNSGAAQPLVIDVRRVRLHIQLVQASAPYPTFAD